jgi:HEAT repeat protein
MLLAVRAPRCAAAGEVGEAGKNGEEAVRLEAALRDLEHGDPRVRAQAADALGRAEEAERAQAESALARAVADAHPSVRYAALLSLGELAAHGAVAVLVAALGDGEALCREAAAIALGQLGPAAGEAAWQPLVEALGSAAPELRFQAIASLAEIAPERAAPLVRPLLDDRDPHVRAQAAAALGDARDLAAADLLARRIDDAAEVAHEAALALARLGDRRCVPRLVAGLDDRERALDAATALGELGLVDDAPARDALARLIGRLFGDPLVKVRAAEALARSGDPRGGAHLARAVRSRREDVRGLAESVLSELGHGSDR